jgi:hypothetical protein
LIGGEIIAIDGTKSRSHNVKNSFFSKAKYCEKLKERSPDNYTKVKKQLWERQWVVFAKKPFGSIHPSNYILFSSIRLMIGA